MSENKTIHQTLQERFPVRRSKQEKADFRAFASAYCEEHGWKVTIEEPSKGRQKNMIIGDPDHAAILLSAHYDTPANSFLPNLMIPANPVLAVLWQALIIILLLAFGFVCDMAAGAFGCTPRARAFAFLGGYMLLLLLMFIFPNKHNANDNTSGVAALLQLAERLPEEDRAKCAILLFDEEEYGCRGSKLYAKDHAELAYMRLLLNLDCVGNGDLFLCSVSDMARRCTGYHQLMNMLQSTPGMQVEFRNAKVCRMRSDHRSFKCGIGMGAFTRKKLTGPMTGRIHTGRDTICDQKNLDLLTEGLTAYMSALKTE